jgi:CYTH domain-containing protein/CHAD domain-containing protein
MAYVIDPDESIRREVRRIATERLDDAIDRLSDIDDPETAIHEARKRCKEARGLARLIAPALGAQFRPFDRTVRDAANQLSSMRDAHAVLATLDSLLALHDLDDELRSVRDRQAALADEASAAVRAGDERIDTARELLNEARAQSFRWRVPAGFSTFGDGLEATYRRGRRDVRQARREPTDEHVHEWRKAVKYLWYQMRLLRDAAPSVVDPVIDQLDGLADALGDDHDLAVLVAHLDADPERFGEPRAVDHARTIARQQQQVLRRGAFRTGAVVFAEPTGRFRDRIAGYWRIRVDDGPEVPAAGIPEPEPSSASPTTTATTVERERKFVIEALPDGLDLSDHVDIRQGYLVTDEHHEHASVRVRDAGRKGCTLTVKAGQGGAERTELEWTIGREQFDAAWEHTSGRRITKRRYRIPLDGSVVELDVFDGALRGLVVAEVEFSDAESLEAFVPPPWFGSEVTDDRRYANAALATTGLPDDAARCDV